ncbi:MAG: hemolysin family protein [Pseudomonadota bacterium]
MPDSAEDLPSTQYDKFSKSTLETYTQGIFGGLSRLFKKSSEADYREAIEDIVSEDGTIGTNEQQMLMNVLVLKDLRVSDLMVQRANITAVDCESSLETILEIFKSSQHSRLPVYQDSLDNPLGFVHVKDALALHLDIRAGKSNQSLKHIIRNILYVPGSVSVRDLLIKMQSVNIHIALVVDEYGGTDGMVTIENLIEQIVGKINDENDGLDMTMFTEKAAGVYEVDARLELEELLEATGFDLSNKLSDIDVDTVGGFVTAFVGRVPQRGEIIEYFKECEFHIIDAEPKHIKRLRIVYHELQPSVDIVT